jgi:hypothetical protein
MKQKLLQGCRGLIGDSRAKVFWFFFSKKNFFMLRQSCFFAADERRVQDFRLKVPNEHPGRKILSMAFICLRNGNDKQAAASKYNLARS